tara:strand:+ start:129 stop:497 length:369 start_codon:yes stop_codon:yes gene_type:complete
MNPLLNKILGKGAQKTIKAVYDVVDRYTSTPEEKAAIKASIEAEISKRWSSDMTSSDSWLSKNVRPLTLIVVIIFLVFMTFFDGLGWVEVNESWISLWNMLSVTVVGGYFAVRTLDKRNNVK